MTRFWQLGAVLLLVSGFLISATVALARLQPPAQPDGLIEHACPDSYEVDDLWTAAKNLSVGAPQAHSFDGNTNTGIPDKDWVKFPVVRTGVYTLTTYNLSAQADTFVKLFDASGNPVYSNGSPVENDDYPGTPDFGSQIVSAPGTASGDYDLRIENNPRGPTAYANCAGTVVSYTLSLQSKAVLPLPSAHCPKLLNKQRHSTRQAFQVRFDVKGLVRCECQVHRRQRRIWHIFGTKSCVAPQPRPQGRGRRRPTLSLKGATQGVVRKDAGFEQSHPQREMHRPAVPTLTDH